LSDDEAQVCEWHDAPWDPDEPGWHVITDPLGVEGGAMRVWCNAQPVPGQLPLLEEGQA
jgi:hypothetical protein